MHGNAICNECNATICNVSVRIIMYHSYHSYHLPRLWTAKGNLETITLWGASDSPNLPTSKHSIRPGVKKIFVAEFFMIRTFVLYDPCECILFVWLSKTALTNLPGVWKWAFAQWNLVSMLGKFWSLRFGCQVWAPGRVIAFVVQHGEKSPLLFSHLLTVRISTISALNAKNGTLWWEV